MAEITRLQVIALRDKGVITPQRAADWLSVLDRGGVLDVEQRLVDQAPPAFALLPAGITVVGDGQIEIDFNTVTRKGLLRLNAAGVLRADQTTDLLQRQREAAARPETLGGQLVDTARFAFDPTDPRGTIEVAGIPVKTGLAAAGLGTALPALAAPGTVTGISGIAPGATRTAIGAFGTRAGPVATPTTAGVREAGGQVAGTLGRLTGVSPRSIPRLAGTTAVGGGTGLAVAGALGGGDAPPPAQLGPPGQVIGRQQGPQTDVQGMVSDITNDVLSAGGTPEQAQAEINNLGIDVQYITRRVQRFDPSSGQIREVDSIIPIITEQVPDGLGGFQTVSSAGAPFFPELAQAQFELEQRQQFEEAALAAGERERARQTEERGFGLQERRLAAEERSNLLQALPSLVQFFSQLADPRTANLLRISSARERGLANVPGLEVPDAIRSLFGLTPGAEGFPSGIRGTIDTLLGATGGFQAPELVSQLTPGTALDFTPEELGAAQAALIGSGTTLEEQQRRARRSALPGGASVRGR